MDSNEQGIRNLCDDMIVLMEKHQDLYGRGLVGLGGGNSIHVNEKILLRIPGAMVLEHRSDTEFPYEYQKTYRGITFFAITKEPLEVVE